MIKPEEIFESFIRDTERKTLILKGEWGVGKTHAWKQFVAKSQISETALSYVSLFGLKTIQDVRQQILINAAPKNHKDWKSLGKVAAPVMSMLKGVPYLKVPFGAAEQLAPLLIRKFLICFDDLERKSKELSLSSLLGLVSVLKEEHCCRIVLIFNEGQLEADDLKTLKTYREKVIDQEVEYKPTASSNIQLVFEATELPIVQETLRVLDINNIRIIKYTQWCTKRFCPFLEGLEQSLRARFLKNLTLLTCLFHKFGTEVDLKTLGDDFIGRLLRSDDAETSAADKFLQRVVYMYRDFDAFIIEYLHNGFFDDEGLKRTLSSLNQREKQSHIDEKLGNIWQSYHSNFRAGVADVILSFRQFVSEHLAEMKIGELLQVCQFVKIVGHSEESEHWLDSFIEIHLSDTPIDGLEFFKQHTKNATILERIDQAIKKTQEVVSLKSIVYRIAEHSSWNPKDVAVLNSFSQDDYYDWLKSETDASVLNNLRIFNQIFTPKSSERDHALVGQKLEGAIRQLANEDILNKVRAEKILGIQFEDSERDAAKT